MKRILLFAGIGFVLIAFIIVLVTIGTRRNSSSQQPAKTTAKGPVTLTVWRYTDEQNTFDDLINQFVTENPDIKVEYFKKNFQDYEAETTNALAENKGPDVWSIPSSWLERHKDKLVEAPEGILAANKNDKRTNAAILKERYVPVVSDDVVIDNKLFGLPLTVDTLALYVNTAIVNQILNQKTQAGVQVDPTVFNIQPKTWDELVTFVKALTGRDKDKITSSVIGIGSGDNVEVAPDLLAAIMIQNKTQMISPDGLTASFNLPAKKSTGATFNPGMQGLDFYTAFANPAKEVFTWDSKMPAAQEAFMDSKIMMAFGYSDFDNTIKQLKPDLRYSVLPLPQIAGTRIPIDFALYPVEVVTKNAENADAAWRFVRFVSGNGLQHYLSATRRPSPLKIPDAPKTPLERSAYGSPYKFQQQTAVSWNRGKDPEKISAVFRQMIGDVVDRGINSQAAIDSAAKQVTEILRQSAGFEPQPTGGQ